MAIKKKRELVTFWVLRCWNRSARAVRDPSHRLSVLSLIFVRFSSESGRNQRGIVVGLARRGWTFPGRLVALYVLRTRVRLLKQHL